MSHEGYFAAQAQAEANARLARRNLIHKSKEVPHLKRDQRYHRFQFDYFIFNLFKNNYNLIQKETLRKVLNT